MTRAHMTDPQIVRKIIEKREDEIRPRRRQRSPYTCIDQGGARIPQSHCATVAKLLPCCNIDSRGPRPARRLLLLCRPGGLGWPAWRVSGQQEVVVFELASGPGGDLPTP